MQRKRGSVARERRSRIVGRAFSSWLSVAVAGLAVVAVLAQPAVGSGPTNVSGTISSNTTWTLANSPYVMTGDVSVSSGVTLTIQAGVVVEGNASSRTLRVDGSLSAVGTSTSRITFTST